MMHLMVRAAERSKILKSILPAHAARDEVMNIKPARFATPFVGRSTATARAASMGAAVLIA
jgi:hypothetical protein